jgi:hypothetical protein
MIDTKLIAVHQWIVDESQKKPGWWAEHVMLAATCLDIVRRVLTWKSGWDAVTLLITLIVATVLVKAARHEVLLKSIGDSKWIRGFFLGLVALQLFFLFTTDQVGVNLLDVGAAIFMLSYYCFAGCDAPRPRKRKEKLVLKLA